MSRIILAKNIGSIDVSVTAQDDNTMLIEASTTITAFYVADTSSFAAFTTDQELADQVLLPLVEQVRDKARKVAAESEE